MTPDELRDVTGVVCAYCGARGDFDESWHHFELSAPRGSNGRHARACSNACAREIVTADWSRLSKRVPELEARVLAAETRVSLYEQTLSALDASQALVDRLTTVVDGAASTKRLNAALDQWERDLEADGQVPGAGVAKFIAAELRRRRALAVPCVREEKPE